MLVLSVLLEQWFKVSCANLHNKTTKTIESMNCTGTLFLVYYSIDPTGTGTVSANNTVVSNLDPGKTYTVSVLTSSTTGNSSTVSTTVLLRELSVSLFYTSNVLFNNLINLDKYCIHVAFLQLLEIQDF